MLFNDFGTAFGGRIFDLRINYRVITQVNEQVSFFGPVLDNQVSYRSDQAQRSKGLR